MPARDNPGLELGAIIGTCANAGRDKLTLIGSPGVTHLGAWLEQLLAESTGKQGRGVIPVDAEPLGAPEVYGSDRLFAYIRLVTDDDADQDAKVSALETAGHPVVRIDLSDPRELGGEFFRWEFATAVAGSLIGIDPFDQPDVEEAKVKAREITDAYDETGAPAKRSPSSKATACGSSRTPPTRPRSRARWARAPGSGRTCARISRAPGPATTWRSWLTCR